MWFCLAAAMTIGTLVADGHEGDVEVQHEGIPRPVFENVFARENYVLLSWNFNEAASGYLLEAREGMDGVWMEIADLALGVNSFEHRGVTASTTYVYRVRAYNSSGYSDFSAELVVTTPPPRAASLTLEAIAINHKEIELRWNDMATDLLSSYTLQRLIGEEWVHVAFLSALRTNFIAQGLLPSAEYSFRLMVRNADGASEWSYATATTLPLPATAPVAPTLYADAESQTVIRVKWLDVELETEYRIERKDPGGEWKEIASMPAGSVFYIDGGLMPSTRYAYRVRAANAHGISPYSNESAAMTRAKPHPPEVPVLIGGASSHSVVQLLWEPAQGAQLYRLERKNATGGWDVIFETGTQPFRYVDEGLQPVTTYIYRVGARNAAGNWIYSAELNATTYPPTLTEPPVVTASATSSSIELSWEPLPYAEVYYVAKWVEGRWIETQLPGHVTNYVDAGLSALTTYTYRVYGYNAVSSSPYTEVTITTPGPISGVIAFRSITPSVGGMVLRLTGSIGQRFRIQSTGDFAIWNDVSETLTLSADMQVEIRGRDGMGSFFRTVKISD